jgi:hypothetical protein
LAVNSKRCSNLSPVNFLGYHPYICIRITADNGYLVPVINEFFGQRLADVA